MSKALKVEQSYHFYRGEPLNWTRNKETERVLFVEKMKAHTSKIVNKNGFLVVVFDFELSRVDD